MVRINTVPSNGKPTRIWKVAMWVCLLPCLCRCQLAFPPPDPSSLTSSKNKDTIVFCRFKQWVIHLCHISLLEDYHVRGLNYWISNHDDLWNEIEIFRGCSASGRAVGDSRVRNHPTVKQDGSSIYRLHRQSLANIGKSSLHRKSLAIKRWFSTDRWAIEIGMTMNKMSKKVNSPVKTSKRACAILGSCKWRHPYVNGRGLIGTGVVLENFPPLRSSFSWTFPSIATIHSV